MPRFVDDSAPVGLSSDEAARRLRQFGPNTLPAIRERGLTRLLLQLLREPVFLLLFAAGTIYLLLGDAHDALLLLGFVVVAMAIVLSRQRKTEHVLAALRDLSSPRALVLRDGKLQRIPGGEIVVGDLLRLEEGDRIAADGVLMTAHDLQLDESLLTGESVPVSRQQGEPVVSGSMVVRGGGLVEVTATGAATAIGKIGKSVQQLAPEESPLQREIALLIKRFAVGGLFLSLLLWLLFGWQRGDWLGGLLAGITLAMSILPEEFSVILMVFLALGAWRLAGSAALARHASVIEALGAATVLCVDKTGTLTQNRMTLQVIVTDGEQVPVSDSQEQSLSQATCRVLEFAALASELAPFDPMEQAFHRAATSLLPDFSYHHRRWKLVHEYALSPPWMAVTHCWMAPELGHYVIASKGAPESLIRLCRLNADQAAYQLSKVKQLAEQGLRVLAVARAVHRGAWPETPAGFDFEWLGLVGLADPLRPGAAEAVAQCRRAGLRVVMITGDYPATAQAIAQEAGLDARRIITGAQIDQASDEQLQKMLGDVQIFARTLPQQKLRLVQAFKKQHEIVAMTGDGINDAPALKAAHIGISMGKRGTDVAREASSLVLLNDDFGAMVEAVRLGRRIVDNLRKALCYVIGVHVPIAGMALLPLFAGTPLVLTPALVMFLEMIINPASSIVFESEHGERDLMLRPPRKPGEALFGSRAITYALVQGLGLLLACMATFFITTAQGSAHEQARAAVFITMVLGNLAMILVSRSNHTGLLSLLAKPNPAQWWLVGASLVALVLVVGVPWLAESFSFGMPDLAQIGVALLAALAALSWLEMVKFIFSRRTRGVKP